MNQWSSYKIINLIFIGVLAGIFIYAGILYTPGLVNCVVKKQTGIDCISCGLTRDFNSILNLKFENLINPFSPQILSFFLIQFLARLILFSASITKRKIIIGDILISISLFLILFHHLITNL